MDKCSMMLLAGPGSTFGRNEFREELDDNCPAQKPQSDVN